MTFESASVPAGARGLPGRYYTNDAVFSAERERLFTRRWIAVGRAAEVAAAGQYLLSDLAGENILIVRDDAGRVRAFYNVCRHRGARLCESATGRFPGRIQCPYHAWTYALDGQLLAAPHTASLEDFARSAFSLMPVAVAEWEGFLFINLAGEPQPFELAYEPVLGRFAAWDLANLRPAKRIEYAVQANWKLLVENYSECYHCPRVHPALARISPPESGRNDLLSGPFLGGYMTLNEAGGSMTTSGRACGPPVGKVAGEDCNRVYYYSMFPNLFLGLHPDYAMAHFLRPVRARETRVTCEWYFDPETMSSSQFDPADAVEFWDMTNRQDWHICEQTQLGVGSRAFTPGPYTHAEGLLWAFDREYLAAVGESFGSGGTLRAAQEDLRSRR